MGGAKWAGLSANTRLLVIIGGGTVAAKGLGKVIGGDEFEGVDQCKRREYCYRWR